MNRKLIIILVVVVWIILLTAPCSANPPTSDNWDEVTALRAELAKAKDEIHSLKYAGIPSIEQQIKPAPAEWKDAYGDNKNTQIYFNIKFALVEIEQCNRAIRLLADTITDITNPDDPNSLASRITVLEEKVADMPVFEMHDGSPVSLSVPCDAVGTADSNKALKPDDPNEVAK